MKRIFIVASSILTVMATLFAAGPRLRPLSPEVYTEEQRTLATTYSGVFGSLGDLRTLALHPELAKGVLPFAKYILSESTLTPRDRQLLILRTAWRTRSDYLWAKHQNREVVPSLTRQELSAIGERGAIQWNDFERALLRAADELHDDSFIGNDTWVALAKRYGVHELMDAAFTVAETTMLAAVVNSVGLIVEPG